MLSFLTHQRYFLLFHSMLEYKAFGNHDVKVVLMLMLFLDLETIVSSHCSPLFIMLTLQEVEEPKKLGCLE